MSERGENSRDVNSSPDNVRPRASLDMPRSNVAVQQPTYDNEDPENSNGTKKGQKKRCNIL